MNVNAMGTQSSNALSEPSASDKNGVPAGRIADLIARLKREQKSGPAPSAANVEAALQLANGKADAIFAVPSGSRSRIYKLRDKIIALGLHDDAINVVMSMADTELTSLSSDTSLLNNTQLSSLRLPRDLLVQPAWVREHAPGIRRLEATGQQEDGVLKKILHAHVDDPTGDGEMMVERTVVYDLPMPGESSAEAAARADRNRRREEQAIRELDVVAAIEHQQKEAARKAARRDEERSREAEAQAIRAELSTIVSDLIGQVEAAHAWVEDHSFHWLPRSPLQLLSWPPVYASLTGDLGMPLTVGSWAWLPDPQNAQPPKLGCVSRWFSNGHAEFTLLNEETMEADPQQRRCLVPSPGTVLSLDERRPRYVGECVRLWGKSMCLGLRGTEAEIAARAASASTCPDYRPTMRMSDGTVGGGDGDGECYGPARPREEMYRFDELGYDASDASDPMNLYRSRSIYGREQCPLRQPNALLQGLSDLAVVTAVHPGDAFVLNDTKMAMPRKWITSSCGYGKGGKETRLGKQHFSHSTVFATGSVDLVLFDARTASFTGPELHNVPLFLVNGTGRSSALLRAQRVAQAALAELKPDDAELAMHERAAYLRQTFAKGMGAHFLHRVGRDLSRVPKGYEDPEAIYALLRQEGHDVDSEELHECLARHMATGEPEYATGLLSHASSRDAMDAIRDACDIDDILSAVCDLVDQDVWEHLADLEEAEQHESQLQSFVSERFVEQFCGSDPSWLSDQERFPDQLPERDVSEYYGRPVQEYDPDATRYIHGDIGAQMSKNAGVLRTDYLLW
jgi:hypothetical protein